MLLLLLCRYLSLFVRLIGVLSHGYHTYVVSVYVIVLVLAIVALFFCGCSCCWLNYQELSINITLFCVCVCSCCFFGVAFVVARVMDGTIKKP